MYTDFFSQNSFFAMQGELPLREQNPRTNTRRMYASARNSIAKKGVQRVEDPLAGSRGSAPCVPSYYR